MGSSSQPSTTTQKTEPPAYQLPYLQQGLTYAQGMLNQGGPQQYQGNTVVPFSSQTEQALGGIEQRATQGSPVIKTAQNFVTQGLMSDPSTSFGSGSNPYATSAYTAGGQNPYASPVGVNVASNPYASADNPFGGASNPYLDQTFKHAADQSYQNLSSEFARGGRNINAAAPVQADMLSNLATQIYAPAYENERNRQLQYQSQLTGIGATGYENTRAQQLQAGLQGQQIGANSLDAERARQLQAAMQGQQIGASGYENAQNRALQDLTTQRAQQTGLLNYATPLAESDYRDLSALQGVGSTVEDLTGRMIDDRVNRFNYDQQLPQQLLDQYMGRVSGNMGMNTTSTQPVYRNQTAGALGGAMGGAQLGSMFGPWGTAIGAIGGGLLGGFG